MTNPDQFSQHLIDTLADALQREADLTGKPITLQRFTPSIKLGRRYLHVGIGDRAFSVTLEVEA